MGTILYSLTYYLIRSGALAARRVRNPARIFDITVLIHSIILSEDIQVDEIITEQIYKFVNKTGIRTKLPFMGVIKCLCDEKKVSIPEDTMIPVEPHINSKWMERVRRERTGQRETLPPEQQNEEAAEIPQAP
ncbi:hypothetical protein PIB30_096630 [Stylosanthes scabra]|uniref:Uncharacterized protein n=1 Tax=Stylosanthes scabra TaxID=79078 RepID=A0ABU6VUH0_9FABA|nr:hypothetical protein [Stylosanthes scabra]